MWEGAFASGDAGHPVRFAFIGLRLLRVKMVGVLGECFAGGAAIFVVMGGIKGL